MITIINNEDNESDINTDYNTLLEQRIITSDEYNMVIEVNPTFHTNFFSDPYFKVYTNKRYSANENPSRIYILRPEYAYHKKPKTVKLDSKYIAFMIKILSDKYSNSLSGWQKVCKYITDTAKNNGIPVDYTETKMPDYNLLQWNPPHGL